MFNSVEVKNQKPLSAKIYLNLNFRGWVGEGKGGGGSILGKSKLKVPSPGQIFIWGEWGYSGEVKTEKMHKCQYLPKFEFSEGVF